MISARHIREQLQANPFKPFRICLTDGTVHDIWHPEVAWVVNSRVFVASSLNDLVPEDPIKQLSILYISRLEEIEKAQAA